MIVYLSSTSILTTNGSKFFVSLGNSSSICWNINTTSKNYTTGWNLVSQHFKAGTVEGAPVMSAVNWVKYGFYGGKSTSHYALIDYVGVIRACAAYPSTFNVGVREYNSTNYDQWNPGGGQWVMVDSNGKPAVVQVTMGSSEVPNYFDTWICSAKQDFNFEIDNFSMLANYTPMLSAWIDSSNYVNARVSSGVLRISGLVNNSTFGRTMYCDAFTAKMNTQLKLKRQADTWTASFGLTTNPITYREVTMYNGPGSTWEDFCALYIGHEDSEVGSRITGIRVKPYGPYGG